MNTSQWKFFKAGGLLQVSLGSGSDLAALAQLDHKLWVALAYPVTGVEFDSKTLSLIDTDDDGRIRPPEIIEAVNWALARMNDPDVWLKGGAALPVESLRDDFDSCERIRAVACQILSEKGEPEGRITVDDVMLFEKNCSAFPLNGDGVVPPDAASSSELTDFLTDVISAVGGVPDKSEKAGVDEATLDRFLEEAKNALEWRLVEKNTNELHFLGEATGEAFEAFMEVREKIEDYFFRCRLAAFDPRVAGSWSFGDEKLASLSSKNSNEVVESSASLPLSKIEPGRPLSFSAGVNPAWNGRMAIFAERVLKPLLGEKKASLTEEEWAGIVSRLGPYGSWLLTRPATPLAERDAETLSALIESPLVGEARKIISEDLAKAEDYLLIDTLEKIARYRRDLPILLRNFVNLAEFYDPNGLASFQVGTLYLDARSCELCFSVEDINMHASLSVPSRMYLAYCEIQRRSDGLKKTVCAAFTAGGSQSLWVGRAGIFYDRSGRDYDAVIIKVVENSISLKEAFWSPWRKMARMVGEQVNKLLAAKESANQAAFQKSVDSAGQAVSAGQAPPQPQPVAVQQGGGAAMASSVAALGIALGFISTAATAALGLLTGMPLWKTLLAVMGLFLCVSGPSVVMCYFRIRSRDLAPVLNACGWAVNKSIPLPLKLAKRLTREADLPAAAALASMDDPYDDEKKNRRIRITVLLCILAVSLLLLYFLRFYK
jgi:hypothetical protein